jgi:hypothetical protein
MMIVALMRAYATNFPYQYVYIQEGIAMNDHGDAHLFKLGQQYERCLVDILARVSRTARSRARAIRRSSPMESWVRSTGRIAGSIRGPPFVGSSG